MSYSTYIKEKLPMSYIKEGSQVSRILDNLDASILFITNVLCGWRKYTYCFRWNGWWRGSLSKVLKKINNKKIKQYFPKELPIYSPTNGLTSIFKEFQNKITKSS